MNTRKSFVQDLRRQGLSLQEIAERIYTTKGGGLSKWCDGIVLTENQIDRLKEKETVGARKGRNKIQQIRDGRIAEMVHVGVKAKKEIGIMSRRDLFITGVGIYWGEGYKYSGGNQVGFTNSDPKMILLMIRWFEEICGVAGKNLALHVKINEVHKDRSRIIEEYWSQTTGVPLTQFTKTTFIRAKTKKKYNNPEDYYGTLRITIRNGGYLRQRILGWIEALVDGSGAA